ncbi:MAG: lamin tail domain-containing protein [Deltaproteobacteria bacterium]|nr:lamin tail domain-containing protein [Deltaproteobacteria bacterium]
MKKFLLIAGLSGLLMAGCGDDDDGGTVVDASQRDARVGDGGMVVDSSMNMADAEADAEVIIGCGNLAEAETAGSMNTNNTTATAQMLAGPGSYRGELQAGNDVDMYAINVATPGTLMRFVGNSTPGNMVDINLNVFSLGAGGLDRYAAQPLENGARRDVFFPRAGRYFVAIEDQRSFDGTPPTVSAPGTFCYQLVISAQPAPTPTLLTVPAAGATTTMTHSVGANGALGFYRVAGTPDTAVVVNAAAQAATQSAVPADDTRYPDVDTIVTLWDPARNVVLNQNDDVVPADVGVTGNTNSNLAQVLSRAGDVWIIVDHFTLRNEDAAAGGAAGGLQTDVTLTLERPIAAATLPFTDATHTLTAATAARWYLVNQAPNSRVTAALDGSTGNLTDVGVALVDGEGGFIGDDAQGAATATVTGSPLSDRTLVLVAPFDDLIKPAAGVTGAYSVNISAVAGCAAIAGATAPTAGQLVMNEVLFDPDSAVATGDSNKDGVVDVQDDEFVELVNTSAGTLDLGGVSLADGEGTTMGPRFTFTCGTTLAAGASAVVFGGGRPTGTFGAAEVFTGNLSLICGTMTNRSLCLSNNVMESVILSSATGATLSTFAFTGLNNNPNTAYVRCASATPANAAACDMGTNLVLHNTIPTVTARFSPGTKVAGGNFP